MSRFFSGFDYGFPRMGLCDVTKSCLWFGQAVLVHVFALRRYVMYYVKCFCFVFLCFLFRSCLVSLFLLQHCLFFTFFVYVVLRYSFVDYRD